MKAIVSLRMMTNRASLVLAITAVLYGAAIGGRLALHHFDPSFFVCAGRKSCEPALAPSDLTILTVDGYDGQFYYRLALDPWTTRRSEFGITIDIPPYRYQRILLPILAHAIALGRTGWVPTAIIVLNYLSISALGLFAGLFAMSFSRHALWGLAIPLYPGLLLSIDRDLTEVLMIATAIVGLYAMHRHRFLIGSLILALAVLARETILLLVLVLLAASAVATLRNRAFRFETTSLLIPLAAFAAWQLWTFHVWGAFGVVKAPSTFGAFFGGIRQFALSLVAQQLSLHRWLWVSELMLLVGAVVVTALTIGDSKADQAIKIAWASYVVLLCFLSGAVWVEDLAFMRAAIEMMALSFLILMSARGRFLLGLLAAGNFAIWVAVAYDRIYSI